MRLEDRKWIKGGISAGGKGNNKRERKTPGVSQPDMEEARQVEHTEWKKMVKKKKLRIKYKWRETGQIQL